MSVSLSRALAVQKSASASGCSPLKHAAFARYSAHRPSGSRDQNNFSELLYPGDIVLRFFQRHIFMSIPSPPRLAITALVLVSGSCGMLQSSSLAFVTTQHSSFPVFPVTALQAGKRSSGRLQAGCVPKLQQFESSMS
jgi:hypothetical protein